MHDRPEIQYVRSGEVAIAYQVVGDGPIDLVFVPFLASFRHAWELPQFAHFLERLASFSRLILFDKRGTGLSDRPPVLTLETQMDDIRAVLDAVGSPARRTTRSPSGRPTVRALRGHVSRKNECPRPHKSACLAGRYAARTYATR